MSRQMETQIIGFRDEMSAAVTKLTKPFKTVRIETQTHHICLDKAFLADMRFYRRILPKNCNDTHKQLAASQNVGFPLLVSHLLN